jgi:hypothetical protein
MRLRIVPALVFTFAVPILTAAQTETEISRPSWSECATIIFDESQERVKHHHNPRYAIERLAWATPRFGRELGIARLRQLSELLRDFEDRLPTQNRAANDRYVNVHAHLAMFVQDADPKFRDELLQRAIVDADRALAEPKLWVPPPGTRVRGNSAGQWAADKQILSLNQRLWRILLEERGDENAALAKISAIVEEGRKFYYPSDARRNAGYFVVLELTRQAPKLLERLPPEVYRPEAATFEWQPPDVSKFRPIARVAWRQMPTESKVERIQVIQNAGVNSTNVAELLTLDEDAGLQALREFAPKLHRDDLDSLLLAVATVSPQATLLVYRFRGAPEGVGISIFKSLAQADADLALQEARKLNGETGHLAVANAIAGVAVHDWDRAKQLFDHPPSEMAKEIYARSLPAAMIRAHLASHPEAVGRIVEPAFRISFLGQCVEANYEFTGTFDGFEQLYLSLTDPGERDHICQIIAVRLSQEGNWCKAIDFLRRIESPAKFIDTAWPMLTASPR